MIRPEYWDEDAWELYEELPEIDTRSRWEKIIDLARGKDDSQINGTIAALNYIKRTGKINATL